MTDEGAEPESLETYDVYDNSESIVARLEFEGTNAARLAIAGAIRRGVFGTAVHRGDMGRFGFGDGAGEWAETRTLATLAELRSEETALNDGGDRFSSAASAEHAEDVAFPRTIERAEARRILEDFDGTWDAALVRARSWERITQGDDAYFAFLTAGLCSSLERESVMAAVAIVNTSRRGMSFIRHPDTVEAKDARSDGEVWDASDSERSERADGGGLAWPGESWAQTSDFAMRAAVRLGRAGGLLSRIHDLARWRVELGVHSADPIARSLAESAFIGPSDDPPSTPPQAETRNRDDVPRTTSTMVHGTRAWDGTWWHPGGKNFHAWVKANHRSDLYSGGKPYSWSGALSRRHRRMAATRFKKWADSEGGLRTVFAHSYGGEVVARAINGGAAVDEVVLLSAPITPHVDRMLAHVARVMDVRLQTDLVLIGATILDPRVRQSLPNVVPHVISRPIWNHSASHSQAVWRSENIASKISL